MEAPGHDFWRNDAPLDRSPATDGVHSAELFANEARAVVGAADRERPLFLYYAAQTPHAHFVDGAPQRHVAAARRMGFSGGDARSDVAALVAALDEQVGAVAGAFEARKRPLVLWFLGDNGPEVPTRCPLHAIGAMCHRGVHTGGDRGLSISFPRRKADRLRLCENQPMCRVHISRR